MSRNGSKTPTRTIKIYENQVFVKDFDSSAKVTYKLAGKDARLFTVDGSGRLKFKSAPDFETPRDSGRDNVYNVTLIRDSDRKIREPERENIRIEVRDKNEKSKDKGSIGDRVWFDKDGDGIQDRGEAGVAGVTVKLLSTGGKTLATTKTDANGKYLFDDLKPGSYKVKFTAPDGHEFTKRSTSNPEKSGKDSDATSSGNTYTVKLSKGEKQTKVDAGLVKGDPCDASIGDTVFLDTDGDGRRDSGEAGVAGVTVQLLTSGGKLIESTTTSASGKYLFDDLPAGNYRVKFIAPDGTEFTKRSTVGPEAANNDSDANTSTGITGVIKLSESERQKKIDAGLVETDSGDASIGDTVWYDTNGDGLLNNGESGAEGMLVGLLDSTGNVVLNTTTNAAGGYIFEDLDAGVYAVRFTAPDGYEFTTASGDDADAANNDSDADEATGETGTVTLSIGEAERDVDAGLVETGSGTASLGDTVWIDTDGDGELNNGESGAAGVTVELLGAGGAVLGTTTTDANGGYLFDNLDADDYRVRFTAPDGYEFTTASGDAADATNNDSDADEATGETGTVTLSIGEAERDVDAGLIETDSGTASLG
ncbi:SdrD B-like domain-containing protein, partial [Amaricoccus sp. W119]|uniref:SdrD B-like domain-containing protein n=1 Tax=Amaricoccus sp. W119 TaxID=3391833 RepID=UPI0039A4EB39